MPCPTDTGVVYGPYSQNEEVNLSTSIENYRTLEAKRYKAFPLARTAVRVGLMTVTEMYPPIDLSNLIDPDYRVQNNFIHPQDEIITPTKLFPLNNYPDRDREIIPRRIDSYDLTKPGYEADLGLYDWGAGVFGSKKLTEKPPIEVDAQETPAKDAEPTPVLTDTEILTQRLLARMRAEKPALPLPPPLPLSGSGRMGRPTTGYRGILDYDGYQGVMRRSEENRED